MRQEYVVTDEDGNVSWNEKKEQAEFFKTNGAAEKRAAELAKDAPGQEIKIYGLVEIVSLPKRWFGSLKFARK